MATNELFERIQEKLDTMRISKSKMLAELGLNKSYLSDMRAKNTMPAADTLVKIAAFLGTSAEYLVSGSEKCGNFSEEENILLERYRALDGDGKDIVRATVLQELRRMEQAKPLEVVSARERGEGGGMVPGQKDTSALSRRRLPPGKKKAKKKQA